MSLNTFVRSAKVLENITKGPNRCYKCFHDIIDIIHNINIPQVTFFLGEEYGILLANDPITKPLAIANLGGFFDIREHVFKPVLQCVQTE